MKNPVLDRRFAEPRGLGERTDPASVTALWLVPFRRFEDSGLLLSAEEQTWAAALSGQRADQYRRARHWLRQCLAGLFNCSAAAIPLQAPPGQRPQLVDGWGYVSMSHTRDAVLLAWSREPIGVDLERADRRFAAKALARRFFDSRDCDGLDALSEEDCRREVLRQWLVKEAAIKWHGGLLARDLTGWSWAEDAPFAVNGSMDLSVRVSLGTCQSWWIGVAGTAVITGQQPLICLL